MLTMSGSYRIRPAEASDIPVLARHRAGMFRDMGQLAAHLNDSLERATASFLEVAMARAIEALSLAGLRFRAFTELGRPAERIAAVAEREQVDEIMMGVGRHPGWLRWLNPSIAQGVMARTDIPVSVLARGQAGVLERFALPAGVAGLAALLLSVE